MAIQKIIDRFFNGAPHALPVAEPTLRSAPVELDEADVSAYKSLRLAVADAATKFARQEIADVFADGYAFRLDGIQVYVSQSDTPAFLKLKSTAPKLLKKLALDAIEKAQGFSHMYLVQDFCGVSVEEQPDACGQDQLIQIIGIYGRERVGYTFVFDGEIVERPVTVADALPPQPQSPTASGSTPFYSGSTPLLGVERLLITGPSLEAPGSNAGWNSGQRSLSDFPVVLGRALGGEVNGVGAASPNFVPLYGNTHISAEHLLFSLDAEDRLCVTDLSKNGTWLDGKRLPKGEPFALPASGCLVLLRDPAENTIAKSPSLRFEQMNAVQVAPSAAPVASANGVQANLVVSGAAANTGAQETDLTADQTEAAIAILRVRHASGKETCHAITHLPAAVGRDALGDVPDSCTKVSRVHLKLMALQGRSAIRVSNNAAERNGSYRNGREEDDAFVWGIVSPADANGWLTLGEARLSERSVQVRLEQV